ncbi:hypothetical protein QFC19_007962 [Naganishia cerealis]|uniref:Uncharacterized protein n=1 Tax=Naganishia cerealis TaxID=610337 RepID=A0ACC2V591_9TREE|nr:hypothetical protein QFC19_007962 [Naganishia cerealis]
MPKDPQDDAPFTLPADGADTPPSIPEPGQAGEQSKVRVILGLLKRLMGVSDVANLIHPHTREPLVRTYLHDPADDEPLLTAAGGIATPSGNSPALGPADGSDEASIRSFASKTSARVGKPVGPGTLLKSMSNLSLRQGAQAAPNGNGNENSETTGEQVVVFLCEQVSHHPPISSAYYACPEKGVEMTCVDQISAKVSGMTVQVTPGEANKGLFISLSEPSQGAGEVSNVREGKIHVQSSDADAWPVRHMADLE